MSGILFGGRDAVQVNQWLGVKWSALGTSITAGVGSPYTIVLNTLFSTTIQNLGVAAATLSPAGDGNGNIAAQIPNIASDAEIVSLECTNDFRLNVPLGTIADTTNATFYGALYKAVTDILTANSSRKVLLIVPYGDSFGGANHTWNTANTTGAFWYQYCNAIRDTAKRIGVYCCDIATDSQINGFTTVSLFTGDGIHLNANGANQFANTIYKYLLNIHRFVALGLPVFTVQPSNQSVVEGSTATFTAAATGNPTPTYQWQKQESGAGAFNNISGATSSSYTTGVLTVASDNTDVYRCVATNSQGSVNSNGATLTVTSGALVWSLNNAVIGDLSGTRVTPTSINGSNVIQYTPPTSNFAMLWLASGANNAAEWEVQDSAQYYNIAFGEGTEGWVAYGFYKNGGLNSGGEVKPPKLYYIFNASGQYASQVNTAAGNAYGDATKYRAARIGERVIFDAFVGSSWINVFDKNFEGSVSVNQKTITKIGLLIFSAFTSISNVRVGTAS